MSESEFEEGGGVMDDDTDVGGDVGDELGGGLIDDDGDGEDV